MTIETEVKTRVYNNWSNKIHDLLSIGTVPDTKDILACIDVRWYMRVEGRYIKVNHIFDNANTEYNSNMVRDATICTEWSCYKLGNKLFTIKGSTLKMKNVTITANELEEMVFQNIVNHIKEIMPRSSIFFKTVALAKAGGIV